MFWSFFSSSGAGNLVTIERKKYTEYKANLNEKKKTSTKNSELE